MATRPVDERGLAPWRQHRSLVDAAGDHYPHVRQAAPGAHAPRAIDRRGMHCGAIRCRLPGRGETALGCGIWIRHERLPRRAMVAPSFRNRAMRCVGRVLITFCQYCISSVRLTEARITPLNAPFFLRALTMVKAGRKRRDRRRRGPRSSGPGHLPRAGKIVPGNCGCGCPSAPDRSPCRVKPFASMIQSDCVCGDCAARLMTPWTWGSARSAGQSRSPPRDPQDRGRTPGFPAA